MPAGAEGPRDHEGGAYVRLLDTFDATMIVAGSMVGSGIFIVSADIVREVGSTGGSPVLLVAYGAVAAAVCLDLLIVKPEYTWPGFVLVALGVPVFFVWRRRD